MEVKFIIPNPKPLYPYVFPTMGGFIGAVIGLVIMRKLYFNVVKQETKERDIKSNNLAGAVLEAFFYLCSDDTEYYLKSIPFKLFGLICGSVCGILSGTYLAQTICSS